MKILSVEDDPTAALVIEGVLKALGHEVIVVTNVADALEALQSQMIRVVVSDWQMRGADGLDFCRLLRSRPGDYVYFVLLTQQESSEANERLAIDAGVDDFMTKPVRVRDMRSRLHVAERILGYTQQVKQLESFIPICAHCKKVRDDNNYWEQVESFIGKRTGSQFSHGVCPECYEKFIVPDMERMGIIPPPISHPVVNRMPPA